jgi:hypothetical protein
MKNDLIYQTTDYTCAPATVVNALRYLYERDEIRPDVLWTVFRNSLDLYGSRGEFGGNGTSPDAMLAIVDALNMYGETARFAIRARLYRDMQATIGRDDSPVAAAVRAGAVGLARIWSNKMNGHYVLLTGFGEMPSGKKAVRVFDPYKDSHVDGIRVRCIDDAPAQANRLIESELFDSGERLPYALVNDTYLRRIIVIARGESAQSHITR